MLTRYTLLLALCAPLWIGAQGTVKNISITSPALGTQEALQIYLPEGYDSAGTITYPVVYFLHGATFNFASYTCLIDSVKALISSGEIQPMILVKPNGSQGFYLGSMYTNSSVNGNVEDCIINDVIGYIDTHYKTKADPQHRCIFGHSMGAMGSAYLGMKYSAKFRAFASISGEMDFSQFGLFFNVVLASDYPGGPPYTYDPGKLLTGLVYTAAAGYSPDPNDAQFVEFPLDAQGNMLPNVMAKWSAFDPVRLASKLPAGSDLGVYFDCGQQDEFNFYPINLSFRDSLNAFGISYIFRSFQGGHTNKICERMPLALRYLDSLMQVPVVAAPEAPASERLILYPNPASDEITLRLGADDLPRQVEIFDGEGRRALARSVSGSTAGVNISSLLSGAYMIKVVGPDGVRVGKLMKRR